MKNTHLTKEERYTIASLLRQGYKQKDISVVLCRDKSVISREIKRNKNPETGKYCSIHADQMASIRKDRFRQPRKLSASMQDELIIPLLKERLSPEQISGRLKLEGKPTVSHETIYKMIRADKKAGGNLYKYCRHWLKKRKRNVSKSPAILNKKSIEQRPEIVNNCGRFGDCELDLIISKNQNKAILVFVERKYIAVFFIVCYICFLEPAPNAI